MRGRVERSCGETASSKGEAARMAMCGCGDTEKVRDNHEDESHPAFLFFFFIVFFFCLAFGDPPRVVSRGPRRGVRETGYGSCGD